MTPSRTACRAKAVELQELHDRYDSWSMVRDLHFPSIPRGTLCTIAKGGRIPRKHWKALGLIDSRRRTEIEKQIAGLAKDTNNSVVRGKPSEKEYLHVKARKP